MARFRTNLENLGIALAYVCLGAVASWTSATPGLASSAWPPAGVALGAVLSRGNRLLPGVFAGALCTTLIDAREFAGTQSAATLAGLVIAMASGATLQAWVAARLVNRFSGSPMHLATVASVTWFVLMAGPLGCLVNATISTLALYFSGITHAVASSLPWTTWMTWILWLTWWVGDSIGSVAVAPVVFLLMAPSAERDFVRVRAVAGALLLSITTIMATFYVTVKLEISNVRKNMVIELDSFRVWTDTVVRGRYVRSFNLISSLPGGLDAASPWLSRYPGILAAGWVPSLSQKSMAALVVEPATMRPACADLVLRTGKDHGPAAWDAVAASMRQGHDVVATPMLPLTGTGREESGFLMVRSPDPRDLSRGYFVALVSANRMLDDVMGGHARREGFAEQVTGAGGQVVYDSVPSDNGNGTMPREVAVLSPVPGISWQVAIVATRAYLARFSPWHPAASLLGGLVFILMSCGFILFLAGSHEVLSRETSEKERLWTALRLTEGRKAAALEASIDAIVTMDMEGRIVDFNSSAEKMFQHRADEVRGKRLGDVLIPERFRDAHAKGLDRYLETGLGPVLGVTIEVTALRADGQEFPIELQVVAVKSNNESIFTGAVRDISVRKRLEENLKAAKESAEAANAAKSQFLANMSHEIRTPLGAVIGFSELLSQPGIPAEDREAYLDAVRRNGTLLSNVINDILDLSKVEAGRLDIEVRPTDVRAILRDLETSLSVQAREKGIRFGVRCGEEVPAMIQTDPVRLHQILLNIAGNAVKFTRQGEVEVTVTAVPAGTPIVSFSVRDTGPGLTPEHLQRIFTPFGQADRSTTRKFGGTGLGLVLAKKLATLLGGDVVLTSTTPGQGSVFTVTIDAAGGVPAARKVS